MIGTTIQNLHALVEVIRSAKLSIGSSYRQTFLPTLYLYFLGVKQPPTQPQLNRDPRQSKTLRPKPRTLETFFPYAKKQQKFQKLFLTLLGQQVHKFESLLNGCVMMLFDKNCNKSCYF